MTKLPVLEEERGVSGQWLPGAQELPVERGGGAARLLHTQLPLPGCVRWGVTLLLQVNLHKLVHGQLTGGGVFKFREPKTETRKRAYAPEKSQLNQHPVHEAASGPQRPDHTQLGAQPHGSPRQTQKRPREGMEPAAQAVVHWSA